MKKLSIYLSIMIFAVASLLGGCGNSISSVVSDEPVTVENRDIVTTMSFDGESVDIPGQYTGVMVNGVPNGEGNFVADFREENGFLYEYEGNFVDGYFDGKGKCTVSAEGEDTVVLYGTYVKGEFTPTDGEFYNLLGQLDFFGKFNLSDEIIEYIDSNNDIFPAANKDLITAMDIQKFSNKQFKKTSKQEEIGLVKLSDLYAMQVFEDEEMGHTVTSVLARDINGDFYTLYYLGSVELYEADIFTAYALPLASSSFDNIGGGVTLVTVMAAGYIK